MTEKINNREDLDANAMAKGIGRKATDEELIDYLSKESDAVPISLEIAFSQYLHVKQHWLLLPN
jgi:hypothetical protein